MYVARNFTLTEEETTKMKEGDLIIMQQDQKIVESQRPEELPIDLAAEFHIKGPDTVAVAYRRLMAELGIDVDAAPETRFEGEDRTQRGDLEDAAVKSANS
jgi:hypothetical protein